MSIRLREWHRYDPYADAQVIRYECTAPSGTYWANVPEVEGPALRRNRAAAVAAIQRAVVAGDPPGEVRY